MGIVDEVYGSRFLKAEDIVKDTDVTIIEVLDEENFGKRGLVLTFEELEKPWILNKTNAKRLVEKFGPEIKDWEHKKFTIIKTVAPLKGEDKPAIRVKLPE